MKEDKRKNNGGPRPGAGQPRKSGANFNLSDKTKAILETKGKREKTAFVESAILHFQRYIDQQIIEGDRALKEFGL